MEWEFDAYLLWPLEESWFPCLNHSSILETLRYLKFEFVPFYFLFYEFANRNIIWKITLTVTLFRYWLRISRNLAFTAQTKPLDHDTLKPRRESPPEKLLFLAPSILSLKLFPYIYFRYKAIVWPLKRRTSKYIVIGTILAIWIGSALLAIPALLFSRT